MERERRIALACVIAGLLLASACRKDAPAAAQAAPTGTPLASKAFYRVDAGPAQACAAGAVCEARLVLTALGGYHVNKEYPFKFAAEPASAALEGEPSFAVDDAQHGTLTIRFRPAAAGTATVAGVFKLSVCSDDTCEIDKPAVTLAVAVR